MTADAPEGLARALARAGYEGSATDALHPGQARQQVVAWAISRLLGGGKGMGDIWPLLGAAGAGYGYATDIGGADQLLAEDERSAQRAQRVLGLLGVRTSVDDIRGCAKGSPDVLLLQLAELVTAVEAHRGASGGGCGFLIGDSGAAASTLGPQQLMDAACELGPRVWCDTMQLFPRDMTPLMDEYREAGQQLAAAVLDLQGRAHDMPSGSGSPADDEAEHATTAEQLSRGMAVATAAVKQLIGAGKELTDVYEQELSVWAEDTGVASTSGEGSAESASGKEGPQAASRLGLAARDALAGHQDLSSLIEAVGLFMDMHATLQDVPRDWLAEVAAAHTTAADELAQSSDLLGS